MATDSTLKPGSGLTLSVRGAMLSAWLILSLMSTGEVRAQGPSYPPAAETKAAFLKLLDRPKVPAEPLSQKRLAGRISKTM